MLEIDFALPTMIFAMLLLISRCSCDVSHWSQYRENMETTPSPYNFYYNSGRFPGQIDRYHSESSNGADVQGTYSFIDPKFNTQTVDYTADRNGFYPVSRNYEEWQAQPQESEAVKLANERHFALWSRIADENTNPQYTQQSHPQYTWSVAAERNKHSELFRKIAGQHQALRGSNYRW